MMKLTSSVVAIWSLLILASIARYHDDPGWSKVYTIGAAIMIFLDFMSDREARR